MKAYESALSATRTVHAPCRPLANSTLARNLMTSRRLIDALEGLKMRYPAPVTGAADTKPFDPATPRQDFLRARGWAWS